MGNVPVLMDYPLRRLTADERESLKNLHVNEIEMLRKTFKALACGTNGHRVDKETFMKCFTLPGLLGGM